MTMTQPTGAAGMQHGLQADAVAERNCNPASRNSPSVSVVILTLNEQANLSDCLASLSAFDDVHVLDSGSTDLTIEIARKRDVDVVCNPFESFARQRNWAIENIPAKYDWQLHLDADERMTPELADEIADVLKSDPKVGGFYVPTKLIFPGRWLRRAGQYPAYQLRLFHRGRMRFIDHGHGQREETNYPIGALREPYLHLAFSKGLDHWFAKHAVYARQEAEHAQDEHSRLGNDLIRLFQRDSVARRRALKRLSFRLPCRYALRLFHLVIWRRAFLDGAAGLAYARMIATYESMIAVHLQLIKHGLRP